MELPFKREYPDFDESITILENFQATIVHQNSLFNDEMEVVVVQLESMEEAEKLVAEFEDPDGELMYEANSVFGKYEQLHKFRP